MRDRPVLLEAHPNIAVGRVAPFRQRGDFPVLGAIFDVHGIVGVKVYHALALGVLVFARNELIWRRPLLLLCFFGLCFFIIFLIVFLSFLTPLNELLKGFKNDIGDKLVQLNWIRTVLWSLRLILLLSI